MPSVGMRRSTRVLGTRVLRSGRRLSTEPHHEIGKFVRGARDNEWIDILNSADGGDAGEICKDVWLGDSAMDFVEKHKIEEHPPDGVVKDKNVDMMCGIVYMRKRKRESYESNTLSEDKRYGKKFYRKQWRKRCRTVKRLETTGHFHEWACSHKLAIVAAKRSYDSCFWIACFIASVLNYMRRVRIGLQQLSFFVQSKPIFDAYSSHGVLFLQGCDVINNPGKCIISGSRSLIPIFSVDFSLLPLCFTHLHLSMHLRSVQLDYMLLEFSVRVDEKVECVSDMEGNAEELLVQSFPAVEHFPDAVITPQSFPWSNSFHDDSITSSIGASSRRDLLHLTVGLPKSTHQNMQYRNSSNVQTRSSLRRKRGRPPSGFRTQKVNVGFSSDLLRFRHHGVHISSSVPSCGLRSLEKRSPSPCIKELKSLGGLLTKGLSSSYSSANLLIIETNKCYREEGAVVTLELSASNLWYLAVVKDGVKRFTLAAQNVMRPSCCNRFTHAIIWGVNDDWKLEFPNRQDWLIFKELYKECSDRNERAPIASVIPVPGVQGVSFPAESSDLPFVRPDSYITVKDDELVRALTKGTAIYDMDSDDEMWLNEFNEELFQEREIHEVVTPESFELIVDALEKGFHCYPDDHSDEKAAFDFCMHLEGKIVVEAIHEYWIKKRRQKQTALVRIFQLYQPRKTQVIPQSVLRKKRSFKRQASQVGRGKQRTLLQAMVAERDSLEQQNNLLKVQEAKTAADKSEQSAVVKRQRAQILMENADLITYKAMMALRIAEASENAETQGTVASFCLSSGLE